MVMMSFGRILAAPFRAASHLAEGLANTLEREDLLGAAVCPPPPHRVHRPRPQHTPGEGDLLTALARGRAAVRARAALELAARGCSHLSVQLSRATRDKSREVRRAALAALLLLDPESFAASALALAAEVPRAELFADIDATLEMVLRLRRAPVQTS